MRLHENLVYFDTDRDIDAEEVAGWCDPDNEGSPVPDEGSREWWDVVGNIRDQDLDDFTGNLAFSKVGPVVMEIAYNTRYSGFESNYSNAYAGFNLHDFKGIMARFNAERCSITGTPAGLKLTAAHHDGSYTAEVKKLTKHGQAYVDRHGGFGQLNHDQFAKLWNTRDYTAPIVDTLF